MGWPLEQRGLMIALARVERNTGKYGEWIPDAVTRWPDTPKVPYQPDGPFINWADKSVEDAAAQHQKAAGKDANLHGMFWTTDTA